jgi:hypothetical protein
MAANLLVYSVISQILPAPCHKSKYAQAGKHHCVGFGFGDRGGDISGANSPSIELIALAAIDLDGSFLPNDRLHKTFYTPQD